MLYLSEVLMEGHAMESFKELSQAVAEKGKAGEMFFRIDVKPPLWIRQITGKSNLKLPSHLFKTAIAI